MRGINQDDIRYYRDTLERYGYSPAEFGLSVALDKPSSMQDGALTSINVTCHSTRVRRKYPATDGNTWLLNFEQELGCGMYKNA